MLNRYGERVHKVTIDASFTCPNRDGSLGIGGCTFCNNTSFSPNGREPAEVSQQINAGKHVIRKRTGAQKYIAYFQAYTNTYAETELLKQQYNMALALLLARDPIVLPIPYWIYWQIIKIKAMKSGWNLVCSLHSMKPWSVSIVAMALKNIGLH